MGTLRVTNLGKAYKIYPGRFARLREWLIPFSNRSRHTIKWVLKDINFAMQPGEAVGIIGVNGAGKSTLLKMLTGTTRPTTGSVETVGRVAALLELGMGFHPEFTGRQNVYMAGQLLGMTIEEINGLMPQIEDFAEIGDYIDSPVRVYSSGMQVRLAFSIATAKRPDILIVDEALSVGDAYFQQKSFSRIREFKEAGTTLLFVSHDIGAIISICDRAILLNKGQIVEDGAPELVVNLYNTVIVNQHGVAKRIENKNKSTGVAFGVGGAHVTEIELKNISGKTIDVAEVNEKVQLNVVVEVLEDIPRLVFGFMIRDRVGNPIFGTNTHYTNQALESVSAGSRVGINIEFNLTIGTGDYSISTALVNGATHLDINYEWKDLALMFSVINTTKPQFIGCSWIKSEIDVSVDAK